ncbi:MAG: class IV adenylate cyclase [bacterium]|nr:class IV adenylate cyclase [bacterium]
MREIEIKARVADKEALFIRLNELGFELSKPVKQHDVVFGWPGAMDSVVGSVWLRIRTENDTKSIFTLKKSIVGHLDSIEHETVVEDVDELEKIIIEMGYELYSDLTKIRQKAKQGNIEICLDELEGLGSFIEAEKIMERDSDHDEVVAELWELFEKLGLSNEDEVHEGYDVLERRKRGL